MKFESEIAYLNRLKELYAEGSQERAEIEKQITDKLQADKLAKFKETQDRQKTLYEEYFKGISLMSAEEREQQYRLQIDSLNALTKKMLDAAGNDEAKRQKIIEASAIAEKALKKQYFEETTEESFNVMEKANAELAEWLQSDGGKAVTDSFGMIMSGNVGYLLANILDSPVEYGDGDRRHRETLRQRDFAGRRKYLQSQEARAG